VRPSTHNVLITGGGKGIGLALARKFHAAGNAVTIVGRDQTALDSAAASLPGVRMIRADITTADGREAVVAGAADTSVLVNNAGIQVIGEFLENSEETIAREVATNLLAPLYLTHQLLPRLLVQPEAAVLNVTSILAVVPKRSAPVYCATKAALSSFTRSLRWQLEGTAVRVIEVVPPVVDTAMTVGRGGDKIAPDELADQVWRGYLADRQRILVGKARAASLLARLVPSLAERLVSRS